MVARRSLLVLCLVLACAGPLVSGSGDATPRLLELRSRVNAAEHAMAHAREHDKADVSARVAALSHDVEAIVSSLAKRLRARKGATQPAQQRAQSSSTRSTGRSQSSSVRLSQARDSQFNPSQRPDPEAKEVKVRETKQAESESCDLEWMSAKDIEKTHIINQYTLSRLGYDVRRMRVLREVDPVFFAKSFNNKWEYVSGAVSIASGALGVMNIDSLEHVKTALDIVEWMQSIREQAEKFQELLGAAQKSLARDGADSHSLVFPGAAFGSIWNAEQNVLTRQHSAGALSATESAALAVQMCEKIADKAFSQLTSKVACATDKALNHPATGVGFFLANVGLTVLHFVPGVVAFSGPAHAVLLGASGTAMASKHSNKANLEDKLEYLMWKLFLLEGVVSGKAKFADQKNPEPKPCDITRAPNHGCDKDEWCQIEFSLVENAGRREGKGFCAPQFGQHNGAPGSPCMDNSDCASAFCHLPYRARNSRPEDRLKGIVGKCRVALPATTTKPAESISWYTFKLSRDGGGDDKDSKELVKKFDRVSCTGGLDMCVIS